MGCICSKGSNADDYVAQNETGKQKELNKSLVQMVAPLCREDVLVNNPPKTEASSIHSRSKTTSVPNDGSNMPWNVEENGKTQIVERPKNGHRRCSTTDMGLNGTMPNVAKIEQVAAGWPSWLASVAGEAIQGWVPRSAESYEKLNKIGQGTYSSVYKARDLANDKIVAMKKVRFVNMDPESVRFMAREICILRRLDHPNVTKLESIVTSRVSGSLYLVFDYMEHDLAGLLASPKVKFTEPQVEQMHKIFKLCGSPSDKYWKKSKLPHATSFKPQHPYKRRVADTFKDFPSSTLGLVDILLSIEPEDRGTASLALKSEFFTMKPLPSNPSTLPKYSPSKEYDAKLHEEELRRQKAKSVKGGGAEFIRNNSRPTKAQLEGKGQSNKSINVKYNLHKDSGTGFPVEPPRGHLRNGYSHSNSMIHPNALGYLWNKKLEDDTNRMFPEQTGTSQHGGELRRESSQLSPSMVHSLYHHSRGADGASNNDSLGCVRKRTRILCSGPLMAPGGNMEDMLKEHERQIQEAVRRARLDKAMPKKNCYE